MGMGANDIRYLIHLCESGVLQTVKRVCDIGASQFYCKDSEGALLEFFNAFNLRENAAPPSTEELAKLADLGYARVLWERCGVEYICIDTSDESNALPLDLNFDEVPRTHRDKYDLVLNMGTTEHVANQVTAFKIIHDLTAEGGLMYHMLPFQGYQTHGLVNYTPKFFWMLCRSNEYGYLDMDLSHNDTQEKLHPDIFHSIGGFRPTTHVNEFRAFDSALRVSLRKLKMRSFVPPFDGHVGGTVNGLPPKYQNIFRKKSISSVLKSFFQ